MSAVRYDWTAIRAMWEAGESANSIAQKDGMPTKQAICNHANGEGWTKIDKPEPELDVIPFGNLTNEQRIVVTKMARGLPQKWAGAYAGVSEDTVTRWKKSDPDFAVALQAAQAVFVDRQLGKVADANEWKAGLALLERHPTTRADFGAPKAGPFVAIQQHFNPLGHVRTGIVREHLTQGQEPRVLEHEACAPLSVSDDTIPALRQVGAED